MRFKIGKQDNEAHMNLRDARKSKNLTQAGLAALTGLTEITLSYIENGHVSPKPETRRAIEQALDVRVNWLATIGLRTARGGEMTSWERVEQAFRGALYAINGLNRAERAEFIQEVAQPYLRAFTEMQQAT